MRDKRHQVDMINGPIFSRMICYALPILATSVLQLLYNAADVAVVGKFAGEEALAAVGSTGSLVNLLVNFFVGLAVGVRVLVSRNYGAGNKRGISDTVHTAIPLGFICGALLLLVGIAVSKPILVLMGSPADVIDLSALYLKIYFLGMPATLLLNFGTAILGAAGDTRRPMYVMMASGIINLGLNLLLVIVFHMSVAGVAIATVVAQYFSATAIITMLICTEDHYKLDPKKLRIHWVRLREIVAIGLPAGIQSTTFSFSNVIIQSSINAFGSLVMAGNAAAQNVEGLIFTSMDAFYQATMTFTGQNVGAKRGDRISRIYRSGAISVTVLALVVGTLLHLFSNSILSIYTSDPAVLMYGSRRTATLFATFFLCGLQQNTVGMLRGMGHSLMPMVISIAGICGVRLVWIYLITGLGLLDPAVTDSVVWIYYSYPITWTVTLVVHFICYSSAKRKLLTQFEGEKIKDVKEIA